MRKSLLLGIVSILLCYSCNTDQTLFSLLEQEETGILFNNVVIHNDSLNILEYEYIYNGGGVGVADLNNDGWQDLLFTGNVVDNRLYLNQGDFNFKDVTKQSGLLENKRWSTGVTIVDINLDGLLDLFITSSGPEYITNRSNLLWICQEITRDGIPIYKESSEAYGLTDNSYSTHAGFFDYDNDEDLDLVVINNDMVKDRQPSKYRKREDTIRTTRTDLLFRNDWDDSLGHPVFTDVSDEAGIIKEGFSLGLNIHDFNHDGWKDIFITNDYLSTDLLYINQKDGTFTDQAEVYFKHTSFSAMGNDVVDLDNDGLSEVIALDMLPHDNYRKKTMLPPNNYTSYINNERYGYQYQHVRNTLQKNNFDPSRIGKGAVFAEQALISGIAATDWSWTPLVADFDNDGDRDIIVTNGFPQDVTDRDFIDYNIDVGAFASDEMLLANVPSVKIPNVAFENEGNLSFKRVNEEWGITMPSFSNGAVYADLDNDGDLDIVINNINEVASLYKNNGVSKHNWIRLKLKGSEKNPMGYGAVVTVTADSMAQVMEVTPGHGYISSVETTLHFGLGVIGDVTSVKVAWPDQTTSVLTDINANGEIVIDYKKVERKEISKTDTQLEKLFVDVTRERSIDYKHIDEDYTDYNVQPMLLHKLSQYGPGIAVGDVNDDGREDFYISGSHFQKGQLYLQSLDGRYVVSDNIKQKEGAPGEELGVLFFDADNDGDQDLYTALGGYEFDLVDSVYQDRLYINENGRLELSSNALPKMLTSSSVVRAGDMDQDGDLDLFIGGRVSPGDYPSPVHSYILRNDSKGGVVSFTDVSLDMGLNEVNMGMVTDALWTDYNNDNLIDLIVTGEFMPITILENEGNSFVSRTNTAGLEGYVGWWNSISGGDFDKDGDMDYVVGNYGIHSLTEINNEHPIKVYYKDFDDNGTKDLIPTCWFEDVDGVKNEYPYFGRLEYEKQVVKIKGQFQKHGDYAKATINEILSPSDLEDCLVLSANYMKSGYLENLGDGTFSLTALPHEAQVAPLYGSQPLDVNQDGHLDIVMIGNDYGMEVSLGRMDALDGLVLLGDGSGSFTSMPGRTSGFYVQEDGKSLVTIYNNAKKKLDIVAGQNKSQLKVYQNTKDISYFKFEKGDRYAVVYLEDDSTQRIERYFGSSFLSQSSSYVEVPVGTVKIEMYSATGPRELDLL